MANSGSVGTLSWGAKLDSREFKKGVKRLKKNVKGAQVAVTTAFSAMTGAFTAVSASIGVMSSAMFYLTKQTSEAVVELNKLAKVANTDAIEFQEMAFGAKAFGIESEKLADILKDVNDRVGDFIATGGGPMADFFENIAPKVGVTAEQFAKLGGKDALLLFYDSLEKANLSQAEMTFYLEAMASDLTQLQPLLANNAEMLGKFAEEGRAIGTIMSQDDLSRLERAGFAFDSLSNRIKGLANLISVNFADAFTDVIKISSAFIDTFRPYIVEIGTLFSNMISGFSDWFKKNFENVIAPIALGIINVFSEIGNALAVLWNFFTDNSLGDQFASWGRAIADFMLTFKESFAIGMINAYELVNKAWQDYIRFQLDGVKKVFDAYTWVFGKLGILSEEEITSAGKKIDEAFDSIVDKASLVTDEVKAMKKELEDSMVAKLIEADEKAGKIAFTFDSNFKAPVLGEITKALFGDSQSGKGSQGGLISSAVGAGSKTNALATAGSVEEFNLMKDQRNEELSIQKKQLKQLESINKNQAKGANFSG